MYFKEQLIFASNGISNYRIPSLIVTNDGTVLAFCNDRKNTLDDHATNTVLVLCRKEINGDWSAPISIMEHEGITCLIGSAVHDKETDTSFIFVKRNVARDEWKSFTDEELEILKKQDEEYAKSIGIELGTFQLVSTNSGKTWKTEKVKETPLILKNVDGETVSAPTHPHGCSHGIQLRHGAHKGRLLCPSRLFAGKYKDLIEIRKYAYNNAFYSDDHGKTWTCSKPVQIGTGEGTLIELGNGDILYNSRAYFADGKRYTAISHDGGESFGEFGTDAFLQEDKGMGCNASFLRIEREDLGEDLAKKYLPKDADSITLFVNPMAEIRKNMTICISFDNCKTWKVAKTIYEGRSAYSSLDFSKIDKIFHLIYEKGGEENPYSIGISAVEFDLEWLLEEK